MSGEMNPGNPVGKCFVSGCPLFGTVGRGADWACFCHQNAESRDFSEITNMLFRLREIGESTVDIRMCYGTLGWPSAFRRVQQRLTDFGRSDLLFNADGKDTPPDAPDGRKMAPVVRMWLARLESALLTEAQKISHQARESFRAVPTAKVIGPTHAMQHYSERGDDAAA